MSAKARVAEEAKGTWNRVSPKSSELGARCWAASWDSGPVKAKNLASGSGDGPVVLLHLPENGQTPFIPSDAQENADSVGPLPALLPTISGLLGPASKTPPSVFLIVDLTPLCKACSAEQVKATLDEEGAAVGDFLKIVGCPAVEALERLVLQGATLVAHGGVAQLALKIMLAPEKLSRLTQGSIKRLVLVHPRIPAKCVNAQLRRGFRSEQLTVIFDTEGAKTRRIDVLQNVFPSIEAHVHGDISSSILKGLHVSGFGIEGLEGMAAGANELSNLGMQVSNECGKSLWLAQVTIEMNPVSKQFQAEAIDMTAQVQEAVQKAKTQAQTSTQAAQERKSQDVSLAPLHVPQVLPMGQYGSFLSKYAAPCANRKDQDVNEFGALIVRGNRCVLVRSIETPRRWHGMKFPSLPGLPGESAQETAMRAAAEFCDIDSKSELEYLPAIPPVAIYSGKSMTRLFAFQAARAPPPGPLEDADISDEEDYYDWYTWPRAVAALRDKAPELAALQTMACALVAAASAGHVPVQWGGIFGQEWTRTFKENNDGTQWTRTLDEKGHVNVAFGQQGLLLHHAVMLRRIEAFDEILRKSTSDINEVNSEGETALFLAVRCGWMDGIKCLLEHKADPNIAPRNSRSAPVLVAVKKGDVCIVEELLVAQANVNAQDRDLEHDPEHGNSTFTANPDQHCSGMHYASQAGNPKMLELLVQHKASANLTDSHKCSPLHYCLEHLLDGNEHHVKVGSGARLQGLQDKPAWNGQLGSIFGEKSKFTGQWSVYVCSSGEQAFVETQNLVGPLLMESLSVLLKVKADPCVGNHKMGLDRTFLHTAAMEGSGALLSKAIHAGCPVDARFKGNTALHLLARSVRDPEAFRVLIDAQADLAAKSSPGNKTPLEIASKNHAPAEILRLLGGEAPDEASKPPKFSSQVQTIADLSPEQRAMAFLD